MYSYGIKSRDNKSRMKYLHVFLLIINLTYQSQQAVVIQFSEQPTTEDPVIMRLLREQFPELYTESQNVPDKNQNDKSPQLNSNENQKDEIKEKPNLETNESDRDLTTPEPKDQHQDDDVTLPVSKDQDVTLQLDSEINQSPDLTLSVPDSDNHSSDQMQQDSIDYQGDQSDKSSVSNNNQNDHSKDELLPEIDIPSSEEISQISSEESVNDEIPEKSQDSSNKSYQNAVRDIQERAQNGTIDTMSQGVASYRVVTVPTTKSPLHIKAEKMTEEEEKTREQKQSQSTRSSQDSRSRASATQTKVSTADSKGKTTIDSWAYDDSDVFAGGVLASSTQGSAKGTGSSSDTQQPGSSSGSAAPSDKKTISDQNESNTTSLQRGTQKSSQSGKLLQKRETANVTSNVTEATPTSTTSTTKSLKVTSTERSANDTGIMIPVSGILANDTSRMIPEAATSRMRPTNATSDLELELNLEEVKKFLEKQALIRNLTQNLNETNARLLSKFTQYLSEEYEDYGEDEIDKKKVKILHRQKY